jgi:hypothetical protein
MSRKWFNRTAYGMDFDCSRQEGARGLEVDYAGCRLTIVPKA